MGQATALLFPTTVPFFVENSALNWGIGWVGYGRIICGRQQAEEGWEGLHDFAESEDKNGTASWEAGRNTGGMGHTWEKQNETSIF